MPSSAMVRRTGLVIAAVVLGLGIGLVATHQSSRQRYLDVGTLKTLPGDGVKTVFLHSFFDPQLGERRTVPVVLIRSRAAGVVAFLGRDTQSGCRLLDVSRPGAVVDFPRPAGTSFLDPCHGAAYDKIGTCLSGPCPRDLDRLVAWLSTGGDVWVDRDSLIPGAARQS